MKFTKTISTILSVILMAVLLAGTAFAEPAEEKDYLTDIDYYGDGAESHLCDIFGVDGTVKPVIVEVHGGAYMGGSKETNTDHSIYWAENGFIVVDINYTLYPAGTFETSMDEFFQVLHFIEENAEQYGFDTNNVFISGDSAGGTHVQMIAATWTNEYLQQYYNVSKANLSINGLVITCMGVADLVGGITINKVDLPADMCEHYDLPTYMNAEEYPPCILIGTAGDKVAGAGTLELDQYLTEVGVEHELVYPEGKENKIVHVFNVLHTDWIESIEANGAAVEFLKAHMK